jgi:glutathione S-transferase
MTESCAICHYLATRPGGEHLAVPPDHPAYGDMLNWLYHADATLTFPQTIVLRYTVPGACRRRSSRSPTITQSGSSRACAASTPMAGLSTCYLVDDRFTIADICMWAYALYLAERSAARPGRSLQPQTLAYLVAPAWNATPSSAPMLWDARERRSTIGAAQS